MNRPAVSAAEWRTAVSYNPETGVFHWAAGPRAGKVAGSVKADCGRICIRLGNNGEYAHRIAWCLMTGELPTLAVDHIDGNPGNNRWSNLRLATRAQNRANSAVNKNTKSGVKGVYPCRSSKRERWYAAISVAGRTRYLGAYESIDLAAAAYSNAAREAFGQFYRENQCA